MKKIGKSVIPFLIKERTKEQITKSAENIREEPNIPGGPDSPDEPHTHDKTRRKDDRVAIYEPVMLSYNVRVVEKMKKGKK